ncbi:hypothetical protein BSLG_005248 [Batrachochytrium salamandrivorans]|nr:hypothetical protein BSLG_005248 [Batrachochytrium salamandrivorans]
MPIASGSASTFLSQQDSSTERLGAPPSEPAAPAKTAGGRSSKQTRPIQSENPASTTIAPTGPILSPIASEFVPAKLKHQVGSSINGCPTNGASIVATTGTTTTTTNGEGPTQPTKAPRRRNRKNRSRADPPSTIPEPSAASTLTAVPTSRQHNATLKARYPQNNSGSLSSEGRPTDNPSRFEVSSTLPSGLRYTISRSSDPSSSALDQQQSSSKRIEDQSLQLASHTASGNVSSGRHCRNTKGRGNLGKTSRHLPSGAKSTADLLEALIDDLTNQVYDCMVCYDIVKSRDSVWSCSVCYAVFHLKCISQWARKSAQEYNGNDSSRSMESWRCPGCQSNTNHAPLDYRCFCTKVINPTLNSYACPHSCGQTCRKDRNCIHKCPGILQIRCAELSSTGTHSSCDRCPCGKFSALDLSPDSPRVSCDAPPLLCGELCDKVLICGHKCELLCHFGPCSSCNRLVTTSCRCGKDGIQMSCITLRIDSSTGKTEPPLCSRPCAKRLKCRRHNCQETCCKKTSDEHSCPLVCGKLLSCKSHRCMNPCGHLDKCHDCIEGVGFDELMCNCGRTVMYPPIPCGTPPLKCNHPCRRPRPCGHPNMTTHYCHDDSEPCPPCMTFVERRCACQSSILKNVPCSRLGAPSCVKLCSQLIKECSHPCKRICHSGACSSDKHPCIEKCGRVRSKCQHICIESCHGTQDCPETVFCKQSVNYACPCGNRIIKKVCGSTKDRRSTAQALECDESCLRKRRNERLADALGIDISSTGVAVGSPSTAIVALSAEKTFAELVNDSSKQYFYFPKQRMFAANTLIIELAAFYGFTAELVDANVGKGTVVVRRVASRPPYLPSKLLSKSADEYNPNAPAAEASQYCELRGVPLDAEVSNIKDILKPVCNLMNLAARLCWISDVDFLITYERYAFWGSIKEREAEVPSMLADRVTMAMVVEIGWAKEAFECQVLPSGVIRLQDNQILERNTNTSALVARRANSSVEEGWKAVRKSKNTGIPINEGFMTPAVPVKSYGGSPDVKKDGSFQRWYDDEEDA